MSSPVGTALGVDFGTSHTVAVIRWPDGRARPLLIDGSPLLPSAVFADSDGSLVVGRDAVHSARLDPSRYEPNPKRCVDDGIVLLGDHELPVGELITAVLSRVAEECRRAVGDVVPTVTLTCPATWGATRRTVLSEAAARAGFPNARLVAEPVAAATYFAEVLGRDVPMGSVVVVHDFGAGTFDASVVARRATGFEVLAVDGCDDLGGIDIDAAVVEYLRASHESDDPAQWQRLTTPSTVEERRAKLQLWDDVRVAKERLSRTQRADLMLPLLGIDAHLTRQELEELAKPLLERTVRVTAGLMGWAGLAEGNVAGVFLVGGSSRIPLMATLLHRALGEPPVVIEQPELVVAEGSILAEAALLSSTPAAPGPTALMRLPSFDRPPLPANGPVSPAAVPASGVGPARGSASGAVPAESARPAGSSAPVSPAGTNSDEARPGGAGASAEATVPLSTPPASPTPAPPVPPPAPTSPAAASAGASVGRVIVPGALPAVQSRPAGKAKLAETRRLPGLSAHPPATVPVPPKQRPRAAAAAHPGQRVPVSPGSRASSSMRPPSVNPAARGYQQPRARRRPGPLVRFVRGLFIAAFLAAVPLVAGWIAYQLAQARGF